MFRNPLHLGVLFVASLGLAAALPQQASAQFFSLRTPGFGLTVGNGGYYNSGVYSSGYYVQPAYVQPAYGTYVGPSGIVYPNYAPYGAASYATPGYVAPIVNTGVYYNQGVYHRGGFYAPRRIYGGRYWR